MRSEVLVPLLVFFAAIARGQKIDVKIPEIPKCISEENRVELAASRRKLTDDFDAYNRRADGFRGKCGHVRSDDAGLISYCQEQQSTLEGEQQKLIGEVDAFKSKIDSIKREEFAVAAGDLVAAMNAASTQLQRMHRQPKGPADRREVVTLNCQDFFRNVLIGLRQRRKEQGEAWHSLFSKMNADEIARTLLDEKTRPAQWQNINSLSKAQCLANHGAFVVGVTPADPAKDRSNGHLAIVFPTPQDFDLQKFDPQGKTGSGPFVRDGNEHDLREKDLGFAMSSWGAVRASRVAPPRDTGWFLFIPSATICDQESDRKDCNL